MNRRRGPVALILRLLEPPAQVLVGTVRIGARHRRGLSTVALGVTLIVGAAYLMVGALDIDPTAEQYTVRVNLADSGGLLPGQDVTLRGTPIGRVETVDLTTEGLVAVARIDATRPVPAGGEVRVAGLSPAGEQYLDFRPDTDTGPFLTDGAVIEQENTSTPVPLYRMLSNLDETLAQIDPAQLASVVDELGVGPQGPQKLADIIDGGAFLLSTVDAVLPQTKSLIKDSRSVLTTFAEMSPGLRDTAHNADALFRGVEAKDGGLRTMLDSGPGAMHAMDAVIADNSPTMVQLLGNLATVAQLAYVRTPALEEFFFPANRDGSTLESLASILRDGGLWGFVNIYPRKTCDYPQPRGVPTQPDFPEPNLHTYCPDDDPSLLIRGARNAPRPPGDDTAGPPPGADPNAKSSPAPTGEHTIPLPFGGPDLAPK